VITELSIKKVFVSSLLTLTLAVVLLSGQSAKANFSVASALDESSDISSINGLDIAHDGDGGLVYVKRDGGVEHIFVSTIRDGSWQSPQRVDAGFVAASADPVIAAGPTRNLAVAWVNSGSLYAAVLDPATDQWSVSPIETTGTVSNLNISMGVNGHTFISYVTSGVSAADVKVARYTGSGWVTVGPLDANPAADAGYGAARRPSISAAADGSATVAWGESGRVYTRSVWTDNDEQTRQSSKVVQVDLPDFEGHVGGEAYFPEIKVEDIGNVGWIIFNQYFDDGGVMKTRTLVRRMKSKTFEAPVAVDAQTFPAVQNTHQPRIDMSTRGFALTATTLDNNTTVGSVIFDDRVVSPQRLDAFGSVSKPYAIPVAGEYLTESGLIAWQREPGGDAAKSVQTRYYQDSVFGEETTISNSAYGDARADLGLVGSADRYGDVAVAFIQEASDGNRRLGIAHFDRDPVAPSLHTTDNFKREHKTLKWRPSEDLWSPVITYKVFLNGAEIATTTNTSFTLPTPLTEEGIYEWKVIAVDKSGNSSSTDTGLLRIDTTSPEDVRIRVDGGRRAGERLKVTVKASDVEAETADGRSLTSGIKSIKLRFGDGSKSVSLQSGKPVKHTFKKGGVYSLKVEVCDRAGNCTDAKRRVRVGKAKR